MPSKSGTKSTVRIEGATAAKSNYLTLEIEPDFLLEGNQWTLEAIEGDDVEVVIPTVTDVILMTYEGGVTMLSEIKAAWDAADERFSSTLTGKDRPAREADFIVDFSGGKRAAP